MSVHQNPRSQVTVLEVAPEIMGAEDSDAAALIREVFREDAGLYLSH